MLNFLVIFVVVTRCLVVKGVEECLGECLPTDIGIISYLPHHDCDKYCICIAGQPQVMSCKPDEHWSEEHEICTTPAEAKCEVKDSDAIKLGCVSYCPDYHVLIGHHECAKYCDCVDSQASVKDCRDGYYFSTIEQTCVRPEDSDCPPDIEPPPKPSPPPPTRPPPPSPTRPPPPPPTKPPPTDSKGCIGKCPLCNSPDKTHQLPHKDHTKFCKCNWGKPIVFQCPLDLVYNQKEEVCDYPYGPGGCPDSKSDIES